MADGPIHPKPSRVPIVKAEVASVEIPNAASSLSPYEDDTFHIESGVGAADVVPFPLPPGFKNPEWFVRAWRDSAALQPPIEAYASDIDGLGHTFVPAFDPNAEGALDDLREAHELHRAWEELYSGKDEKDLPDIPDDAALKDELEGLRRESRKQLMRAQYFFQSAVRESSFTRMRKNTRQQGETGGNWYWEIVRKNGVPIRLKHPPFQSMRVLKEDDVPIKVTSKIQVTPIHWVDLEEFRRFRRYVQKTRTHVVTYFKQFGDPRHMCAHCGRYIKAKDEKAALVAARKRCQSKARLATEIMHDGAVHVPGSPYFFPRWLGAKNFVFGEGAASEMNLAFFNNPVPAGMILCAGGKFADDLKDKLQEFMTQAVVKSRGFHKILTVSAVADDPSLFKEGAARVNLQWIPLIKDRPKDAQFLKWMAFCEEKVGRQFRLNILMYGGSEKLNKATAWAVLKFTEERVYQPLRSEFDDLMDRTLLPAIGVTLWKFKTNSPETRDPTSMSKIYDILQKGPALSVDELRELASDIVNRQYATYGEDWSKFPHKMLEFAHDEESTLGTDGEDDKTESDSGDEDEDHTEPPDTGEGDTGESDSE